MDAALKIFEMDVVPKIAVQRVVVPKTAEMDVVPKIFEMDAALKTAVQKDVVPKTAVQKDVVPKTAVQRGAESALPPVHCLIVVGVVCCREFFR
jgi:hypothetical protein